MRQERAWGEWYDDQRRLATIHFLIARAIGFAA
jgi:hypothetical protein